MLLAIDANTLRPSHCKPQPGLPLLLRLGHTPSTQAPVLMPWPFSQSLWLHPTTDGDVNSALAVAQNWILQALLQAPSALLRVHVYDQRLESGLPALERIGALASAHDLPQCINFITDADGLHHQLGNWRAMAIQRKSQLQATGHQDWAHQLNAEGGEPFHLLLVTHMEEVVTAQMDHRRFHILLQQGPRLGFGFVLVGGGQPPASISHPLEQGRWQTSFDSMVRPNLLEFAIRGDKVAWPPSWRSHPAVNIYDEFGGIELEDLKATETDAAIDRWLKVQRGRDSSEVLPEDDWSVRIGTHQGAPFHFRVGRAWGCMHSLLAGKPGSGKSALLRAMMERTCATASVDDIQFSLFDFQSEPSFGELESLSHVTRLCVPDADPTLVMPDLRDVLSEAQRREQRFQAVTRASDVKDFASYNHLMQIRGRPRMPLLVVVIDDAHRLFERLPREELAEAMLLLLRVAQTGGRTGISLLLSSSSFSSLDLPPQLRHLFRQRLSFQLEDESECHQVMGPGNLAPLHLPERQLLVNSEFGRPLANRLVRVDELRDFAGAPTVPMSQL